MRILSKRATVRLSPKIHERLFQLALKIEQHPSVVMRQAILDFISKHEIAVPRSDLLS